MKNLGRLARKYVWVVAIVAVGLGIWIDRTFLDRDDVRYAGSFSERAAPSVARTPSSGVFEASANEAIQAYNGQRPAGAYGAQQGYQQYQVPQQGGVPQPRAGRAGYQAGQPGNYPQGHRSSVGNGAVGGVPTGFSPAMQNTEAANGNSMQVRDHQTAYLQQGQYAPDSRHTAAQQGTQSGQYGRANTAGGQFWGVPLRERPQHFLLGYGSLLNSKSRGATSGKVTAAVPVRVSADFGYIREWNFRSPTSKLTALGIRKRRQGEAGSTINGVIYPVEGGSIEKFDEREEGYKRVLVPRNMIEAVGWMALPREGQIWVYVPEGPSGEAGVGLPLPDAFYPVLQSYIDICVTGALEYGEDFAREFLETTYGWGPFWLNDRELPRRPWVHQKSYKKVDALLAQFPADQQRNSLHLRRLPTEYPLHFSNQHSRR